MKTVYLMGCIKRDVVRWIQKYSNGDVAELNAWYCGVTHVKDFAPLEKFLKNKGITNVYYRRWFANDANAAQEIVGFFAKNGMKTKPFKGNVRSEAKFIYIFKDQDKVTDEIVGLLS